MSTLEKGGLAAFLYLHYLDKITMGCVLKNNKLKKRVGEQDYERNSAGY